MTWHLKTSEAQRQVLAIASGRHVVTGHLIMSKTVGTSPTHNIYIRHALGKGVWDSVEGVWFKGLNIPVSDYIFSDGTQTASTAYFPTDKRPHTGTVMIDVKCPTGVGEVDTGANVPEGFTGIFKTEKFPDFDEDGNQIDPDDGVTIVVTNADLEAGDPLDEDYFTYTVSPARVLVGWLFKYGKIKHSRINWAVWDAWRDYLDANETVDYTTLDIDGFGLTGKFYSGTNFDTLVSQRIDSVVEFLSSAGAPALGLPVDSFSVRYEGKVKPKYSETYTFKIIHDKGARLFVNNMSVALIDQWATIGTHTATIALTAGQFYDIKVEWFDDAGNAELRLLWSSASQTEQIIPSARLYPKSESRPRYEAHVAFSTPTTVDFMRDEILRISNSIYQEVDGKMEFYCVEQLTPSFHFEEALPENERQIIEGSLSFSRADVRISELQNVWEAKFRDLDSQYLEEPVIDADESVETPKVPYIIEIDELIDSANGRRIYGEPIEMYTMTRWQARKVLLRMIDRAILKDLIVSFDATARCYQVIKGDVVELSHTAGDWEAKEFEVIEAIDKSPEETSDTRSFRLQEL